MKSNFSKHKSHLLSLEKEQQGF